LDGQARAVNFVRQLAVALSEGLLLWAFCAAPGSLLACWRGGLRATKRVAIRLLPVAVFYAVYALIRMYTSVGEARIKAEQHAASIVHVERDLHIWWEPWLSHHPIPFAELYYEYALVLGTIALLSCLAATQEDALWRWARNSIGFITAVAMTSFALYPLAPPRLLPHAYGVAGPGLGGLTGVADQVAAMPSVHTAWAAWAAVMVWAFVPGRLRWLGFINMVLTVVVILTTGNHYVLDVVAGEALTALAFLIVRRPAVPTTSELTRIHKMANQSIAGPDRLPDQQHTS
jgi:PAP2 superfamily